MVRIEGIPVVAARLAAELKTVQIRQQRTRRSPSPKRSTILQVRRPRLNTAVCA